MAVGASLALLLIAGTIIMFDGQPPNGDVGEAMASMASKGRTVKSPPPRKPDKADVRQEKNDDLIDPEKDGTVKSLPPRPANGNMPKEEIDALIDPDPFLFIRFHDYDGHRNMPKPTMRFGVLAKDPDHPGQTKKLTYDEHGVTNSTVIRLDSKEFHFGQDPDKWIEMKSKLQGETAGRPRDGLASIWSLADGKLRVTQQVEIVPGPQSHPLDTCLVRYVLENRDSLPHRVGIRFLLDTFIGSSDGVPFGVPGSSELCDTKLMFNTPDQVPDFIQALEKDDLSNPGIVAYLQFRIGPNIESPSRVQLGGWPNKELQKIGIRAAQAQLTGWEVPFISIKERVGNAQINDSAVTMYWNEQTLDPGKSRVVGFTYGLGKVDTRESGGHLLLTAGGRFEPSVDFSLLALVHNPKPDETLTLQLPSGIETVAQKMTQKVPAVPPGASRPDSPVTWRLRASKDGKYEVIVRSSTGVKQKLPFTIRTREMSDKGGEQAAPAPPVPIQPKVNLPADASVDDLRKALKSEELSVQQMAARRLADLGPKAEPALADLEDTLTNPKYPTKSRELAALAIGHIGPPARSAVPSLVKMLDSDERLTIRQSAVEALMELKYPANESAHRTLLKIIEKDSNTNLRNLCIFAVTSGNQAANFRELDADKVFTKLLDEKGRATAYFRYNAAHRLAYFLRSDAPPKTMEVLLEWLKDKETNGYKVGGSTCFAAAEALAWLGDKVAKRPDVDIALHEAARGEDQKLRAAARKAMKDLEIKE